MRGGCGLFTSGLYNCIASACIDDVWGMNGTLLRCAGGLKPLDTLCCATPEVCDGAERA
jgi:hypothetical protein